MNAAVVGRHRAVWLITQYTHRDDRIATCEFCSETVSWSMTEAAAAVIAVQRSATCSGHLPCNYRVTVPAGVSVDATRQTDGQLAEVERHTCTVSLWPTKPTGEIRRFLLLLHESVRPDGGFELWRRPLPQKDATHVGLLVRYKDV